VIEADWALFDGHHAVLHPERMTPLELQLSTIEAMRRFYSISGIAGPALRGVLRHLPELLAIVARHAGGLLGALGREARRGRGEGAAAEDGGGADAGRSGGTVADAAASSKPVFSRALATVMESLSREEVGRLESALGVAALRLFGHRQVGAFWSQDHSHAHAARLAALPSAAAP